MVAIENTGLLRRQPERVAAAVKSIDAPEQRLVHKDAIPVLGLERREVALDRKDRVIGVGAGEHMEKVLNARERSSAQLHRLDGVGKGRLGGIAGDCGDLRLVRGKGMREGWREILRDDPFERRHAERPGPLGQQRIVDLCFKGQGFVLHGFLYGVSAVAAHSWSEFTQQRSSLKHVRIAASCKFFRCERLAALARLRAGTDRAPHQ